METKKPRSRAKKVAAAAPETSVVGAFGGVVAAEPAAAVATGVAPAIFVEEVDATPPPAKKPAARKTAKPPVVAAVTPDGVQGSLTPMTEQRPLIAHLPIHAADLQNDMFAPTPTAAAEGGQPRPFDPDDVLVQFQEKNMEVAEAAPTTPTPPSLQPSVARPSLPLHYSEKLMIRFQDANRAQELPDTTDVACFWDCHPFRSRPCVIPIVIEEDIWRVYGNFCCPECAAAYLFNERLDSHVKWERYALLNRLYAEDGDPVRLSPPRATLRMFGGTLDVVDYRTLVAEKRMRVDVMTPPMISIIQVMDTKPIDFYDASIKNTFIPWEMDRMNRPGAQGLRLRRTKPVAEKEATLEWCMGITS
jgi:hypothetical protein